VLRPTFSAMSSGLQNCIKIPYRPGLSFLKPICRLVTVVLGVLTKYSAADNVAFHDFGDSCSENLLRQGRIGVVSTDHLLRIMCLAGRKTTCSFTHFNFLPSVANKDFPCGSSSGGSACGREHLVGCGVYVILRSGKQQSIAPRLSLKIHRTTRGQPQYTWERRDTCQLKR